MPACYVNCIKEAAIYFNKFPNEGEINKICDSKLENGIEKGSIEHIMLSLKRLVIYTSWFSGKIDINKADVFMLSNNSTWILAYWNKPKSKRGMMVMTLVTANDINHLDFSVARKWLEEEKFTNGLILSKEPIGS